MPAATCVISAQHWKRRCPEEDLTHGRCETASEDCRGANHVHCRHVIFIYIKYDVLAALRSYAFIKGLFK